ncbi:CHAT domain-containing protein [Halomonas titanicae]|uniref:CHAT domain-containing protein n=1 Tax=Vreelandella titanicae TaxID=664683 RepID=UPI001F3EB2E4|nr:CHAT domain-containing protein [Halomonas titanicae]MCE7521019.1 CHAT domain-containing protein [Halomonas titanicae]
MSVDMYRRQVGQIRGAIAKFVDQKAKESQKASDAGRKSLSAESAANKTKQLSTITSKLKEANRHADVQAKHLKEVAKLEKKIATENKRLVTAQSRLESEEEKVLKKRNAEHKKMQEGHKRQLSKLEWSLKEHDALHNEAAARIDKLSALPEEIIVAFFATDPTIAADRRLLLDEEVREIHQKIRLSDHRDAVRLESRWALRPGDILQYMNELNPTIVHFSGHGSNRDELVLQDRNGKAVLVSMDSIIGTFELYDSVRLVFFNTCHSYRQAVACTQYIDAAIGMNQSIGDVAARIFSAQFYSAIGFGESVPKAFRQAKNALMLEGISEESTPELHLRDGVDESDLILVRPKA